MTSRRAMFLAVAALPLCTACTAIGLYPRERSFTTAEIQERLARRLPWRRSFPLIEVELTNPVVQLDEIASRLGARFDALLRSPLLREGLHGTFAISGVPRYAAEARALVLADLRVDTLEFPRLPRGVAEEIRRLAGGIAADFLGETPIYVLRPEDGRFFGSQLEPESVRIERDRLVLRVKPRP